MEAPGNDIVQTPLRDDGAERRLHPWSWLFVLGQQLRQFIVPLVALMIFGGRGGRGDFWMSIGPVIAVGALVVISVLQYFTSVSYTHLDVYKRQDLSVRWDDAHSASRHAWLADIVAR